SRRRRPRDAVGARGRGRRHRGTHGRRPHRARDEHLRALLRPARRRPGLPARRPRRHQHRRRLHPARHRLRDRGPQGLRAEPHRRHPPQHLRRRPEQAVARRAGRRQRRDRRRGDLPLRPRHQGAQRALARRAALGRQPAEGRAGEVAVHRARGADPRRAHARHRRRRQVRDLRPHQPHGRRGHGRRRHLLRAAGAARDLRPHLHRRVRPGDGRGAHRRGDAGEPHATHDPGEKRDRRDPAAGGRPMNAVASAWELAQRNVRQSGIVVAFVVICGLFTFLNSNFLSPGNLTNLVLQYSYILILAIGMMIVIIGGHIDLSVGSLVALTGAVAAVVVIRHGQPWWVGVLAALGVGLLVGAWQGFWVAVVGIPAFIVTLAGMLMFRGLTYQVLNNVSLSPFGGTYYQINNGFLNGLLGGQGFDVFTLVVFG